MKGPVLLARLVGLLLLAASPFRADPQDSRYAYQPNSFPDGLGPHATSVEEAVFVPMRDGTRLSVDIYRPSGVSARIPAIYIRTPYGKKRRSEQLAARFFASHGFATVVQDVRGKYESEGIFRIGGDRNDGYDTISWIVGQPWASDRVGTFGCSALGEYQMTLLATRHPNHAAAIPIAGGGGIGSAGNLHSAFGDLAGVKGLAGTVGWFFESGFKYGLRPRSGLTREQFILASRYGQYRPVNPQPENWEAVFRSLPVAGIMRSIAAAPTDYEELQTHGSGDPLWDRLGYVTDSDRFNTPTLHVNSWYDYGTPSTLFAFNAMQQRSDSAAARGGQYLVMSPGVHCEAIRAIGNPTIVGALGVGNAQFDFGRLYLDWFNHWLRQPGAVVPRQPRVTYFQIGEGWMSSDGWPVRGARARSFYLASRTGANGRGGDGRLVAAGSAGGRPYDEFIYDPDNPVPTVGGNDCCYPTGYTNIQGGQDQSEIERRADNLVFRSAPLRSPLRIAGAVEVELHVSSSAPDTDFTVKLIDAFPDGTAFNLTDTIFRVRYREGFLRQVMMAPGRVYRLRFRLPDIAATLAVGHRLGVDISSSNFPRYTRNLNTGLDNITTTTMATAVNRVHHDRRHRSRIIVPLKP